jgi:hypothetical protein
VSLLIPEFDCQVLRNEKEDLYKQAHSLLEERRLARGEMLKQKTELETYRNFSNATKEAVCDDKVDIRGERRMMMLEKVPLCPALTSRLSSLRPIFVGLF